MKPCKAKSSEGESCPNRVDEGQEYCPHHLSSQVADEKKILSFAEVVLVAIAIYKAAEPHLGKVATGIYKAAKPHLGEVATGIGKAAKFIVSKKL